MGQTWMRVGTVAAIAAGLLAGVPAARSTEAAPPLPDDPLLPAQYGFSMIRTAEAWTVTTGTGATVAVLDSGVDLDHPDLAANLLPGITLIGCADGCGTGDWESGGDPRVGESEHGTHVAGTIGAVADNGIGVAGIAPGAKVLPVKIAQSGAIDVADIIAGIRWATDHGADVINLSLSRLPGFTLLHELSADELVLALEYAADNDVLVVASSGNDRNPLCGEPAFIGAVVCVVAVDPDEGPAAYTSLATKPGFTAVAAPGGVQHEALFPFVGDLCDDVVVSTWPVGFADPLYEAACGWEPGLSYQGASGTSMAAPHVSGVAALLRSVGCTAAESSALLLSTARQPASGRRGEWNPVYGHGIVDAAAAVEGARSGCAAFRQGAPFGVAPCLGGWAEEFDSPTLGAGWEVVTSDNPAGTPAWHPASDPLNGGHVVSDATGSLRKDDALWSPVVAVGDRTQVRFDHRYQFRGAIGSGSDGGRLEISVDGGSPAPVPSEAFRRFPARGSVNPTSDGPLAGATAWVAAQGEAVLWGPRYLDPLRRAQAAVVDLSAWAGHDVRLVWHLGQGTDALEDAFILDPGLGWAIDRVQVVNERVAGC